MKWSPAIAGKRGRCKCGATVQVRATVEPPVEAEDDLLSALEKPIRPVVEPSAYANEPSVALPPPAPPPAYARPAPQAQASLASKELVREIYILLRLTCSKYVSCQ